MKVMKRIEIKAVGIAVVAALGMAGSAWAAMSGDSSQGSQGNMGSSQGQEPNNAPPAVTEQQPSQQQPGNLTAGERNFLQSAAEINATVIEAGKLAEEKSNDPNIKKIGQDLVRDHTAANQQLQRLASSKGVSLTLEPTSSQQRMIDRLSETSGDRFNQQFLRLTRAGSQRALSLFERTSRRAQDPDIRSWAGQMVSPIHGHIAMLKSAHPEPVAEKAHSSQNMNSPRLQQGQEQQIAPQPQKQPAGNY